MPRCLHRASTDGDLSDHDGDWTFTPTVPEGMTIADIMVPGGIPDPDYLNYGYWVQAADLTRTRLGRATRFSPMHRATGITVRRQRVDGQLAEYAGPATGQYVKNKFDPGTGDAIGIASGEFYAWTQLTANFGGGSVAGR